MTRSRMLGALRLFVELDDRRGLADGDVRADGYLFGASDASRTRERPFLEEALRTELNRDLAATRAALGDDEFSAVCTSGGSAALDQTLAIALRAQAASARL